MSIVDAMPSNIAFSHVTTKFQMVTSFSVDKAVAESCKTKNSQQQLARRANRTKWYSQSRYNRNDNLCINARLN